MENIKELAAAFSKFQGLMNPIPTNKEVEIPTKTGRLIKFNYATLQQILSVVRPTLAECGLSITQVFSGKLMVTYLMHESGQYIKSEIMLTWPEDNKAAAAEITYFRRYSVTTILGLAAEDDMDGDTQQVIDKKASSRHVERKEDKSPDETITPDQIAHLTSLGAGNGYILNQEFKKYGVKDLPHLPKKHYDSVVRELMKNRGPSALANA